MIRLAEKGDLPGVLAVYAAAREYMTSSGNPHQWGSTHPPVALLEGDIESRQLYVMTEKAPEVKGMGKGMEKHDARIHGVFAFIVGDDPTYGYIEGGAWKYGGPYGTIHRIASDGSVKGVFKECLGFCARIIGNIRIDTHADNRTMIHLIEKHGFEKCGVVYMEDKSARIAYQLSPNSPSLLRAGS